MIRKTKIIATIGPATSERKVLKKIIEKGVNVCRLNFSHITHEKAKEIISTIKSINQELNVHTAILADLQGPKIRIGKLEKPLKIKTGQELVFTTKKPKKNQIFIGYKSFAKDVSSGENILIENNSTKKLDCSKKQPKNKIVALSSVGKPSDIILNTLNKFDVNLIVQMASSYKFCVIATGEYDIYAARERANEWDYAAGHAVAKNAGAIITTLDNKPFLYGKENYKNQSLLIRRSNDLNA